MRLGNHKLYSVYIYILNFSYLALALAALADKSWWGELLASFLPLIGLGGLIWSVVLVWLLLDGKIVSTIQKLSVFIILSLSLTVFSSGVQYFDYSSRFVPQAGLRVASLNKLVVNRDYQEIASILEEVNPGIVGMVEVHPEDVSVLSQEWKYRIVTDCACDNGHNSELMLLSRYLLEDKGVESLGKGKGGILKADVRYEGDKLRVLLAHPKAPLKARDLSERNQLLEKLAQTVKSSPHPTIVMGDFNATPWSREFKGFASSTERNISNVKGHGLYATWCLDNKLSLACAPIDFIFAPSGSSAETLNIRNVKGSDHHIIWTDITLPQSSHATIKE